MTARLKAVLCVLISGCGGPRTEPEIAFEAPSAPLPPAPPPDPAAAAPGRAPGTLQRAELRAELDAGLGRFLQRVELEPELEHGRFRGWRIVALRPQAFWAGVDLAPGDVVLSVNGMPIERETEAFAAFEALRSAKSLTVSYLRGGKARSLTYAIVD